MLLQNNKFIRGKLHMNFKNKWIIPLLLLVTIGLVGCSNGNNKQGSKASNTQTSQKSQVLSGVYKISDKDSDTDDNGNKQPGYYYFKKNGEVLWAQNETGDEDNGNYGGAARGTWKSLGNNMFEIHIKYIYDNDDFTFKAKKTGNKLHTYSNSKNAKYEWDADDNYKQPDMTYSDFMEIFNNGKNSQRQKVQENGYDDPDNDSSSNSSNSSSSNSDSSEMSFDTAAQILQKGGFNDFNYERDSQTHDGSHATDNGGYLMITYPGAHGQDRFTITKTGKNKYHVEAEYGSSDGGFTKFPDQSSYGPTSADVTL